MISAACLGACFLAVLLGMLAGDLAIVESALHAKHHTTAGVMGAAAGAFALDAVVLFILALFAEPT